MRRPCAPLELWVSGCGDWTLLNLPHISPGTLSFIILLTLLLIFLLLRLWSSLYNHSQFVLLEENLWTLLERKKLVNGVKILLRKKPLLWNKYAVGGWIYYIYLTIRITTHKYFIYIYIYTTYIYIHM